MTSLQPPSHPLQEQDEPPAVTNPSTPLIFHPSSSTTTIHNLLLLSDSSLPLGSFAFSSGLESYLAHHHQSQSRSIVPQATTITTHFLPLSLSSLASTSLPYVLAAHRDPSSILSLDDTYDATLTCTVARRASIATGKALVACWERAFKGALGVDDDLRTGQHHHHFAPFWGVVTRLMGLRVEEAAYVFLLNHVRAVVSAGVRIGVLGPYQAQGLLASEWLRAEIGGTMRRFWDVEIEEAGQVVPMLDLWVGRHEVLYSRIFNS